MGIIRCTLGFEFHKIQEPVILLKKDQGFSLNALNNETLKGYTCKGLSNADLTPPMSDVQLDQRKEFHKNYHMNGCEQLVRPSPDNRLYKTISCSCSSDITQLNDDTNHTECDQVTGINQRVERMHSEFQSAYDTSARRFNYYKQAGTPYRVTSMDGSKAWSQNLSTKIFNTSSVRFSIKAGSAINMTDQHPWWETYPSFAEESLYFENFIHATSLPSCNSIGLDAGLSMSTSYQKFQN
jgi:peroxiredoxin family protein